jgi:hypothetical protein
MVHWLEDQGDIEKFFRSVTRLQLHGVVMSFTER